MVESLRGSDRPTVEISFALISYAIMSNLLLISIYTSVKWGLQYHSFSVVGRIQNDQKKSLSIALHTLWILWVFNKYCHVCSFLFHLLYFVSLHPALERMLCWCQHPEAGLPGVVTKWLHGLPTECFNSFCNTSNSFLFPLPRGCWCLPDTKTSYYSFLVRGSLHRRNQEKQPQR